MNRRCRDKCPVPTAIETRSIGTTHGAPYFENPQSTGRPRSNQTRVRHSAGHAKPRPAMGLAGTGANIQTQRNTFCRRLRQDFYLPTSLSF